MARQDDSILEAALVGYQAEARRIEQAIADLQKRIGKDGRPGVRLQSSTGGRKKRHISAEGRARIAEAQRKRWAAAKRNK